MNEIKKRMELNRKKKLLEIEILVDTILRKYFNKGLNEI
jgi:hypothetical protein